MQRMTLGQLYAALEWPEPPGMTEADLALLIEAPDDMDEVSSISVDHENRTAAVTLKSDALTDLPGRWLPNA